MTLSGKGNSQSAVNRRNFIKGCMAAGAVPYVSASATSENVSQQSSDRAYWLQTMARVSGPVLKALSQRQLKATMPVEAQPGDTESRRQSTYLEAMGRLLSGIAPWLENGPSDGEEGQLRLRYCEWARAGIASGTDAASPDYMNFGQNPQSLVDTAFLALAIARAPIELWEKLDKSTQKNVVRALQATRAVMPPFTNWLLFSAMVEAGLCWMGESWDAMRVDYAIREHESWFLGDGMYGDGPHFHWDYYNSYVIQPMLLQVVDLVRQKSTNRYDALRPAILERAKRYAVIQERLISPEGSFPAIGRSLAYRFGAFHHLAEMSLRKELPEELSPEQVRCALTAVMRRMIEAPGTFDAKGWLTIGFVGHQPAIGEHYISTGSCYLCAAAFLPLGLSKNDVFWAGPPKPWTAQRIWSGQDTKADHASDV